MQGRRVRDSNGVRHLTIRWKLQSEVNELQINSIGTEHTNCRRDRTQRDSPIHLPCALITTSKQCAFHDLENAESEFGVRSASTSAKRSDSINICPGAELLNAFITGENTFIGSGPQIGVSGLARIHESQIGSSCVLGAGSYEHCVFLKGAKTRGFTLQSRFTI
jgi:hypothetical protein